jgi:hypothetical protein
VLLALAGSTIFFANVTVGIVEIEGQVVCRSLIFPVWQNEKSHSVAVATE